ncbi:MAG: pilus assembly protein PilM [Candidatus Brocadiia bacterium]
MAQQIWALDLGSWSLKIGRAPAEKKTRKIVLDLYDEIRYDALGLDEEATVMEKIQAGLDTFAEKYTVALGDDLCVAVSGNEVFSRFISLPPVPESISEIIRYEARQQIPFDMDEVLWDYQPLKEEHQPGEEIEVGLFALKQETIGEFMSMLEPWRRNLRVIQDAPLAVYNFLRFEGRVEEPTIVLDMGARTTDVLILNHPRFWLRPLLVGGNAITERLQSHFGVTLNESERIKQRASESSREAQLLRIIRPVVGNMLSEIQRSLGYYKSLSKSAQFGKILALGNAFKLRGLDRVLSDGLQYDVEKLKELRRFDLGNGVDKQGFTRQLGGACTVLGLLVQGAGKGHIRINLVPEDLAKAALMRSKKPFLLGAAAALIIIALIVMFTEKAYGEQLKNYLGKGKNLLNKVEANERSYREVRSDVVEVRDRADSLTARYVDRDIFLELIPSLVWKLPDNPADRAYVQDMAFHWMSPDRFERLAEEAKRQEMAEERGEEPDAGGMPGDEGMPEGGGMPPGAGYGEMPGAGAGAVPDEKPGAGAIPGQEGAMPGTTAGIASAAGENSVLVMEMVCESTQVARGKEYVMGEIIEPLRELRSPEDGRLIFSEVHLQALPEGMFRAARDGRKIPEEKASEVEAIMFLQFKIVAKVNISAEKEVNTEEPETP